MESMLATIIGYHEVNLFSIMATHLDHDLDEGNNHSMVQVTLV